MSILGFVLGGLLGAVVGYALGLSPTWEKVLSPYILALQIAPKVAFAPLFILWFGYTCLAEADRHDPGRVLPDPRQRAAGSMRVMDPRSGQPRARLQHEHAPQIFWKIEFPASMPTLLAGLRIGATLAVIGITVGELVGGKIGLGYLISFGRARPTPHGLRRHHAC